MPLTGALPRGRVCGGTPTLPDGELPPVLTAPPEYGTGLAPLAPLPEDPLGTATPRAGAPLLGRLEGGAACPLLDTPAA